MTLEENTREPPTSRLAAAWRYLAAPGLLYLLLFSALTFPLITTFRTHLFTAGGDGLQNCWNLWWTREALIERGASPWFTDLLFYPGGVSLRCHTLSVWNGLLGIPLQQVLDLERTYNAILVFSFVASGVTAFWLALHVSRSYAGSLVAGAIYTFSEYHFAHGAGHMNLVALECVPLFLLCWLRLLDAPSPRRAAEAALVLFLVTLTDLYYLLDCVLLGVLFSAYRAVVSRDVLFLVRRRHLASIALFVVLAAASSGLQVLLLVKLDRKDPIPRAHDAARMSADLVAPFVPGPPWRFASWTRAIWEKAPSNRTEGSVFVGIAALALALYGCRRSRPASPGALGSGSGLWAATAASFFLLSLGPGLWVLGEQVLTRGMPYDWLRTAIPPLRLGGMPARMMIEAQLAIAVLCAMAWPLVAGRPRGRILCAAILLLLAFERLPAPMPTSQPRMPGYVTYLRDAPPGGFLEMHADRYETLYYQTVHRQPLAYAALSRYPASAREFADYVEFVYQGYWISNFQAGAPLHVLYSLGYRYIDIRLAPGAQPGTENTFPGLAPLTRDGDIWLFAMRCPCLDCSMLGERP